KAACNIVNGQAHTVLDEDMVLSWLGPRKYYRDPVPEEGEIGLVTGLAWTSVGGETLEIEATAVPGKGMLQLTGQLGDVMQESVKAALTYVRANAERLSIDPEIFEKTDLHVHVPEGAVPKDGPSAGIAMMTALTSVLTGIPVKSSLAMTGEITLRGRVLPIGGLREKLLAAVRAGISTVVLPTKNKDDLFDVPESVRNALDIRFADHADDVLKEALSRQPEMFIPQTAPIAVGENHAAICH
ncbi:MAG: endopeptidase La, partial [Clostridia bacterium]|nr:endopeptidase La [Clostridia bacterium]